LSPIATKLSQYVAETLILYLRQKKKSTGKVAIEEKTARARGRKEEILLLIET
jgi:hypothetical protein